MFASRLLHNMNSFAVGWLTKRALYKMYAITGSCRHWLRMSRPLMSSVTEPPLHSWEGNRETPVTRPSLNTVDYDSWRELAHTHKRKQCSITWQHDSINSHVDVGILDKLRTICTSLRAQLNNHISEKTNTIYTTHTCSHSEPIRFQPQNTCKADFKIILSVFDVHFF